MARGARREAPFPLAGERGGCRERFRFRRRRRPRERSGEARGPRAPTGTGTGTPDRKGEPETVSEGQGGRNWTAATTRPPPWRSSAPVSAERARPREKEWGERYRMGDPGLRGGDNRDHREITGWRVPKAPFPSHPLLPFPPQFPTRSRSTPVCRRCPTTCTSGG